MFGNIKPAASLSSGLLARKGQARPAMRPQGFVDFGQNGLEDLGWNDMGLEPATQPVPASAAVPPVLRQREVLRAEVEVPAPEEFAPDFDPAPEAAEPVEPAVAAPVVEAPVLSAKRRSVSVNTAKRLQRETNARKGKAAFTLRLDAERHLQLRLASAICGKSAQQLVTDALDSMLAALPEVSALIDQLPAGRTRSS